MKQTMRLSWCVLFALISTSTTFSANHSQRRPLCFLDLSYNCGKLEALEAWERTHGQAAINLIGHFLHFLKRAHFLTRAMKTARAVSSLANFGCCHSVKPWDSARALSLKTSTSISWGAEWANSKSYWLTTSSIPLTYSFHSIVCVLLSEINSSIRNLYSYFGIENSIAKENRRFCFLPSLL